LYERVAEGAIGMDVGDGRTRYPVEQGAGKRVAALVSLVGGRYRFGKAAVLEIADEIVSLDVDACFRNLMHDRERQARRLKLLEHASHCLLLCGRLNASFAVFAPGLVDPLLVQLDAALAIVEGEAVDLSGHRIEAVVPAD